MERIEWSGKLVTRIKIGKEEEKEISMENEENKEEIIQEGVKETDEEEIKENNKKEQQKEIEDIIKEK
ncbi:hypothetical protein ENUP19_0041G0101 [Entamoeba nuttalli]|uniref:Uncharacterized protein n=1 Tax=Entamoeba nuttalli TaxID=412467 RepID=A0ABQ0DAL9_9EUKA